MDVLQIVQPRQVGQGDALGNPDGAADVRQPGERRNIRQERVVDDVEVVDGTEPLESVQGGELVVGRTERADGEFVDNGVQLGQGREILQVGIGADGDVRDRRQAVETVDRHENLVVIEPQGPGQRRDPLQTDQVRQGIAVRERKVLKLTGQVRQCGRVFQGRAFRNGKLTIAGKFTLNGLELLQTVETLQVIDSLQ